MVKPSPLYHSVTKSKFRIKWKAPLSGPPSTFNFVWQVKVPSQDGWDTQYKIIRDNDLVYTTAPASGGSKTLYNWASVIMTVIVTKLFAQ